MSEELPPGWHKARLGDVASFVMGQAPPSADTNKDGDGIPFVKAGEFGDERPIIREWTTRPLKLATESDVLICVVGATCGKLNLGADCAIGRSVAAIRPGRELDQRFLWRFLQTRVLALRDASSGSAQGVISQQMLSGEEIPLPPLAEQRRIVARIEALFARIRQARADLLRIAPLAEQCRRASLRTAFALDAPRERLEDVAEISSGFGFPKAFQGRESGELPFAKVRDISAAVLENSGQLATAAHYISQADLSALKARAVPPGSTVFAKIGEGLRLNRRALTTVPIVLDNNCMALSPNATRVVPRYLYHFMQTVDLSPFAVATSVPSVRRSDVAALELPVPDIATQNAVVRSLDQMSAGIQQIEQEATRALALLDHLERSILTRAFRGELVPQDPADEPASVSLARSQEGAPAAPRRGRPRRAA